MTKKQNVVALLLAPIAFTMHTLGVLVGLFIIPFFNGVTKVHDLAEWIKK